MIVAINTQNEVGESISHAEPSFVVASQELSRVTKGLKKDTTRDIVPGQQELYDCKKLK